MKTFFLEITSFFGPNYSIFSVYIGLHKPGNPSCLSLPRAHFWSPAALNTRTEILAIASSHIAHLCNNFNYVFARIISIPRFNNLALILIKICLRLKIFCQKITKFSSAGSLSQIPATASQCKFLAMHLIDYVRGGECRQVVSLGVINCSNCNSKFYFV